MEREIVHLSDNLAGRAVWDRRLVSLPDLKSAADGSPHLKSLVKTGFQVGYAVPLIAQGQVKGVIEVLRIQPYDAPQDWLEYLETLGGQAAIAVQNTELFDNLQRSNAELVRAYDATLEGWAKALELRDEETQGHSQRVTELTVEAGRRLGIVDDDLVNLRRGALVHDIGKMAVPDEILRKPGPLTEEEWVIMRQHPVDARKMLSGIPFLSRALDVPYYHHERWNGSGYPMGLKGEQIPLAARIFAVVDVWDALTSDRPYRPRWTDNRVRQYLLAEAGISFDAHVVEVVLDIVGR